MKTQHTPGPWYIEDDFIEPNQRKISCQGLGLALTFGDTEEEAQANAALVSAAPELLEACLQLIDLFDNRDAVLTFPGVSDNANALTNMRVAIAKARGES